jgi:GT2 family glycosyltransferase
VVYARNLAISVADGELLVFVDDDVQIHDENFLNKHIKAHAESGPNVVAVCGRENNPGSEASLAKKLNYKRGHPIYDVLFFPRNYEKRIEAAVLSTCNCSVKKETMLELGCFDENFSGASYGDDSDLALRLIQKGYKIVYDPSPALIHLIAPMGGLRLSTSNRIKSFSSSEKVVSSIVFYLKHIHRNHRKLRFYYIYNYILRKSLFLRANVHKPWILPKVFLSLVWTFPKVKRSLGQGHKFSFKK